MSKAERRPAPRSETFRDKTRESLEEGESLPFLCALPAARFCHFVSIAHFLFRTHDITYMWLGIGEGEGCVGVGVCVSEVGGRGAPMPAIF